MQLAVRRDAQEAVEAVRTRRMVALTDADTDNFGAELVLESFDLFVQSNI